MPKQEGLAKAVAMMAVLAALATMLAVYVTPPTKQKAASTRGSEMHGQRISAPVGTPRSGVGPESIGAGAAQGQVAAVERREAGGGRAPNQSGKSLKASGTSSRREP